MRLKNVAIPNIRHSCFLNSVYVGNFNLKSKKNIVVDKIKQTKYNRQIKKIPTEKQNVSLKHILT